MKNLVLALLAGIVLCSATAVQYPGHGSNGLTYESPSGYAVEIPEGWEYGTGLMGADLFAIAPPAEGEKQGTANFNVMVGDSGGLTLEQFYKSSLAGLEALVDDLKIERSSDAKLGGVDAKMHIYTYPHHVTNLKVLQYVVVDGPTVFVLTFTTGEDDFSHYQPTFDGVVKSFKFVKPTKVEPAKAEPQGMPKEEPKEAMPKMMEEKVNSAESEGMPTEVQKAPTPIDKEKMPAGPGSGTDKAADNEPAAAGQQLGCLSLLESDLGAAIQHA